MIKEIEYKSDLWNDCCDQIMSWPKQKNKLAHRALTLKPESKMIGDFDLDGNLLGVSNYRMDGWIRILNLVSMENGSGTALMDHIRGVGEKFWLTSLPESNSFYDKQGLTRIGTHDGMTVFVS